MKKYLLSTIKEFALPLIILITISAISILLFVIQPFKGDWQGAIFSNIATEVLGIIITVIFLDAYLSMREQNKRNERQSSFLKTLRQPIHRHLSILFNIYKATRLKEGKVGKIQASDFFDEEYFSHIILLDLAKTAPVYPARKWILYLAYEIQKYFDELDHFLDKYSFEMDLECIQLIESIKDNSWLNMQVQLNNPSINLGNTFPLFYPNNTPGDQKVSIMKEYHALLTKFITYVNTKFDEEYKIVINADWSPNVSPGLGSGRLDEAYLKNKPRIV